jgi:hypothetical protein
MQTLDASVCNGLSDEFEAKDQRDPKRQDPHWVPPEVCACVRVRVFASVQCVTVACAPPPPPSSSFLLHLPFLRARQVAERAATVTGGISRQQAGTSSLKVSMLRVHSGNAIGR